MPSPTGAPAPPAQKAPPPAVPDASPSGEGYEEIEPERASEPDDDTFSEAITAERQFDISPEARAAFEAKVEVKVQEPQLAKSSTPPVPLPASAPPHEDESFEEIEPEADATPTAELAVDVELEAEPEVQPKKPPPVPPKRGQTPADAPAVAPSPAGTPPPPKSAQAVPPPAARDEPAMTEPATRKRQKPWWEELFGDDFIRTMDKLESRTIRREADFIEESLGVEKGAVILDLACGTGAHAVELASRGYSVVGYDLSLAMLARAADEAQERGQKLNFLQGDMREMAFDEMFDGVYCWSMSFGYFDDEKNFSVLQRAFRALRQGGMLLLDVTNRDYVAARSPSLVWFEGDGCVCMDEMHVDFFSSRLRVRRTAMFEDGRTRELDYSIRLYSLHELGKMLHECGFKVVEVTGHPAHPGVYFGAESPRVIILAERA